MTGLHQEISSAGVSFVVPVRNGARFLDETLGAIDDQDDGRPFEVLVVDDESDDESGSLLVRWTADPRFRLMQGGGRGAAAAINRGVRAARYPFIAQVDQDVILKPGWMRLLLEEMQDSDIAGAQGYFETDRRSSVWARVAGYDLELRYARLRDKRTDHICTGNAVYRTSALHEVGLFDESLGYGYDNDMSYRLGAAGYRLSFVEKARSHHRWRESALAYLRQQYGQGYGRLDLVNKHPGRFTGDAVSGAGMILQVPVTGAALLASLAVGFLAAFGVPWNIVACVAAVLWALPAGERLIASVRAWRRFADPAVFLFVPAHLARNCAWVWASVVWVWRRFIGSGRRPRHSMRPRGD